MVRNERPRLVYDKSVDRMLEKVSIDRETSCWVWTGARDPLGYGRFTYDGMTRTAHRLMFCLMYGDQPASVLVCHNCDNPSCINPSHLYAGSAQSNMDDMMARGRNKYWRRVGQDHPRSKITQAQALEIADEKRWGDMSQREVGEIYGITQTAVSDIRRGHRWKHLPEVKP